MADNDLKPMGDADITPPPAGTDFQPAEPLKDAGVDFAPDTSATGATTSGQGAAATARQALKDGAGNLQQQAGDKLRAFADTGKERAGGALDDLSRLLTDAAAQVDEKLGAQYGQYARSAADQVQGFAETVRNRDVDALVDDVRGFVRASPAVAVGIAAAIGFAAARLVQAGLDADGTRRA